MIGTTVGALRKLRRKGRRSEYVVEPLRPGGFLPVHKMSEVILEFAEPLLNIIDDDRYFRLVIALAVLCWDISLYPQSEQQVHLNNLIEEMVRSKRLSREVWENCTRVLLDRKKTLFADDRRFIVNYKIVEEGGKERLLVMSTHAKE